MQPMFLVELLEACKREGLHTAVDTSGQAEQAAFEKIMEYTDLFLYDVKHMDPIQHKKFTGASNELVLSNLALLRGRAVVVRVPLVPGVNDDEENIRSMGEYVSGLGFSDLCLLPYHKVGTEKAHRLNRASGPQFVAEAPTDESLDRLRGVLTEYGLSVKIGG